MQGQPAGSYLLRPSSQLKGSPYTEKKRKVLVLKENRPSDVSLLDIVRILKGTTVRLLLLLMLLLFCLVFGLYRNFLSCIVIIFLFVV
jgi:hypothetical protein